MPYPWQNVFGYLIRYIANEFKIYIFHNLFIHSKYSKSIPNYVCLKKQTGLDNYSIDRRIKVRSHSPVYGYINNRGVVGEQYNYFFYWSRLHSVNVIMSTNLLANYIYYLDYFPKRICILFMTTWAKEFRFIKPCSWVLFWQNLWSKFV